MTQEQFIAQIDRLHNVYGEKAYPKERMDVIWEKVRHTSREQFERAITQLIGECFSPPALSRILDATGTLAKTPKQHHDELESFKCDGCKDRGFDFIRDIVTACTCLLGRALHPEELARLQKNYDAGRRFLPSIENFIKIINKPLPYNPNQN